MSSRPYSMAVRAEQAARTRERILDAALACYREAGISATSLQAVARRAEVSAATVLNHFGSADGLAQVVVERLAAALHIPDDEPWPEKGRSARVRRLVREMFEFYERSRPWFDIFRAELDVDPALREGQAGYWRAIGELYTRVVGDALRDERVRGAVFRPHHSRHVRRAARRGNVSRGCRGADRRHPQPRHREGNLIGVIVAHARAPWYDGRGMGCR